MPGGVLAGLAVSLWTALHHREQVRRELAREAIDFDEAIVADRLEPPVRSIRLVIEADSLGVHQFDRRYLPVQILARHDEVVRADRGLLRVVEELAAVGTGDGHNYSLR
jgi:hypothetical protein